MIAADAANRDDKARIARDAVVWLTDSQAMEAMRLINSGARREALQLLLSLIPDLPADVEDPIFLAQLTDELAWRLAPPRDEDPDDLATREVPNYARFAQQAE